MTVPEHAGDIRVLIVDDHRMFADSLSRVLGEETDITVVCIAYTAAQGLASAAALCPQVALVDQHLPDRLGVSIIAELQAAAPGVAVVMLAGVAEEHVLAAAIEAGCVGYITKDQVAASVTEAIRAAAVGESVITPAELAMLLPTLRSGYTGFGSDLTERERQILGMLSDGRSNAALAEALGLSINTVRNNVQAILSKLNAHSKLEAVAAARRAGIVTDD